MVKVINGDGWKLYDGVKAVSHAVVNGQIGMPYHHEDFTSDPIPDQFKGEFLEPKVVRLIIEMNQPGDVRHVIAWSPVFILNDNGKTVERV